MGYHQLYYISFPIEDSQASNEDFGQLYHIYTYL